jgi:pimeloyl-[acyl-carrier protein] methyl ester esterase
MQNNVGQNWILLRGLTREAAHWGDFILQLQIAFPKSRIHTLDLPGTGVYYQQTSPNSVAAITRQVRQQAYDNGWLDTKISLLSMSLGGMVAWEWMLQYPNDINAGILINISLAGLSPFYQRMRWQCYLKLVQIIFQRDVYPRELGIIKLISNNVSHYEKISREWAHIQVQRPVSSKNALNQIIAAANYRPKPDKPILPILLLSSVGDGLVAPACSSAISERWSIPLMTHPWAGHDLCIDDSSWVIEQLQQWLVEFQD